MQDLLRREQEYQDALKRKFGQQAQEEQKQTREESELDKLIKEVK